MFNNSRNRNTVFLNSELLRDDKDQNSSSKFVAEKPTITGELSPSEIQIRAPGQKNIQHQNRPFDLKLLFKPQNPTNPSQASQSRSLRYEDPWKYYQGQLYLCDRGESDESGHKIGAYSIHGPKIPRMVIKVASTLDTEWLQTILKLHHKHIVLVHEIFVYREESFLVYEMMDVSLSALLATNLALSESQVAKICAEVLQSIIYLSSQGLIHGNINYSTVQFGRDGRSKLGCIHGSLLFRRRGLLELSPDVWSMGRLMLQMLEKGSMLAREAKIGDTLSFSRPECWSVEAKDFLRNTASASAADLTSHGFLRKADAEDSSLEFNIWLAGITASKEWRPF